MQSPGQKGSKELSIAHTAHDRGKKRANHLLHLGTAEIVLISSSRAFYLLMISTSHAIISNTINRLDKVHDARWNWWLMTVSLDAVLVDNSIFISHIMHQWLDLCTTHRFCWLIPWSPRILWPWILSDVKNIRVHTHQRQIRRDMLASAGLWAYSDLFSLSLSLSPSLLFFYSFSTK